MDLLTLNSEMFLQVFMGGFIIFQLQRMIEKIGSFGDRLAVLETEHKLISGECRVKVAGIMKRKNDLNQSLEPTD